MQKTVVKQVRVVRNAMIWSILCAAGLALVRGRLWEHWDALLVGAMLGGLYGLYHWRRLSGTIARRDRRYARNKIFVHYLDAAEFVLNVVAYHYLLTILVGTVLAAVAVLSVLSDGWLAVLIGSFGLARGLVLIGYALRYEQRHGPLYYQYDSRTWSGAEGMLYRDATVVKPLTPEGKVDLQGELWNAVSISGEPIDAGEHVEVIAVEHLTLYVDRMPP